MADREGDSRLVIAVLKLATAFSPLPKVPNCDFRGRPARFGLKRLNKSRSDNGEAADISDTHSKAWDCNDKIEAAYIVEKLTLNPLGHQAWSAYAGYITSSVGGIGSEAGPGTTTYLRRYRMSRQQLDYGRKDKRGRLLGQISLGVAILLGPLGWVLSTGRGFTTTLWLAGVATAFAAAELTAMAGLRLSTPVDGYGRVSRCAIAGMVIPWLWLLVLAGYFVMRFAMYPMGPHDWP